jgi:gamma-glutamyltranspeptidase/glutathione hydrolase
MPVLAANVVATSQPLAAQAGLDMIRQGGNAVDAAVATAIAMTVLEPTSNGIGSDAFALIWHEGKLHGLNGSGRAPKALTPARFEGNPGMPHRGWDPVTVPGAVSAWVAASKKFGKLPFARLFEPAIRYAEQGFPVAPQTAQGWAGAGAHYNVLPEMKVHFPHFAAAFLRQARAPGPGEKFAFPDQAKTLRMIAETNGEAFYRGRLAEQIAAHAKATGGLMTVDDLAAHSADWVEPISVSYRGHRLHEIPPNGQGIAALLALGALDHHDLSGLHPDCPDVLHVQIEAMKLGFADAHRYVADPAAMDVKVADLLRREYLAERARLIDYAKAQNPGHGTPRQGGTILLVAADAGGTMVSFIQSNYEGFGSGVVIPRTGIAMQNRGACFTLEKGHPNEVGRGKRPYHTIIPAFVTRPRADGGEDPVMAYGVMGGFMQPQGHVQVMSRLADAAQNPQAALDAPRWQVAGGLNINLEPGFDAATVEELRRRGHQINLATSRHVGFGGGQAVMRLDSGYYLGASDARRDGQAVGL